MRRRSSLVGVLTALLVSVAVTTTGCGDCDVSCVDWEEFDVTRIRGTYLGPADGAAGSFRFDTVEHGELEVEVFGNTDALDRGDDYLIAYLGTGDETEIQASLPRDCSCGPTITHADGSDIETGFWQVTFDWWPSWTALIFVVSALSLPLFAFAWFTRARSPDLG